MIYEKDPLGAWKEIENNPQIVKFLGGKRCKPNEHAGEIHLVVGRAPGSVPAIGSGNCA
jgi:hypothetical protein